MAELHDATGAEDMRVDPLRAKVLAENLHDVYQRVQNVAGGRKVSPFSPAPPPPPQKISRNPHIIQLHSHPTRNPCSKTPAHALRATHILN